MAVAHCYCRVITCTSPAGLGKGAFPLPEVLPEQELWERLFYLALSSSAVFQGLCPVSLRGLQR